MWHRTAASDVASPATDAWTHVTMIAYDWPREGPIAIARSRREAGRRPNRACAVTRRCVCSNINTLDNLPGTGDDRDRDDAQA